MHMGVSVPSLLIESTNSVILYTVNVIPTLEMLLIKGDVHVCLRLCMLFLF